MRFPSWLTWYKKPEYRDIKEYATDLRFGKRQLSPDGRGKTSIPSSLKLERILKNKTCSPMSLYDFYMYLKYIEFSAENLEFYLWYKRYEMSWLKAGSEGDSSSFHSVPTSTSSEAQLGEKQHQIDASDCDVDLSVDPVERIAHLISSEAMCGLNDSRCAPSLNGRVRSCIHPVANTTPFSGKAITSSNQPLDVQAELDAVVETFLLPGSAKELNIPPSLRDQALSELQHSSDPAHLRPIVDHVYGLLRNCSHRNFVRLGVSNGTFETVCAATGLGIILTCVGFLVVLLRAFVPFMGANARWDVFACWPLWWLGVSLILSGLRGSCFFLLLFSRRQPLPWERFDDSASVMSQRFGILKALSRLMIESDRWGCVCKSGGLFVCLPPGVARHSPTLGQQG